MTARVVARTSFGVLVAVDVPSAAQTEPLWQQLHPDERATTGRYAARRLATYTAGRHAARAALAALGVDVRGPILSSPRGAPLLPRGGPPVLLSVSHKDDVAVALAQLVEPGEHPDVRIGVDLEHPSLVSRDIATHVLTPREQQLLAHLDDDVRRREVATRFSMKEALYKALDPFVQRFVGFEEAEADPALRHIALTLSRGEGPFLVDADVHDLDHDSVVSLVRVRRG